MPVPSRFAAAVAAPFVVAFSSLFLLAPVTVSAQSSTSTSLSDESPGESTDARDREFQRLAEDVAALQRQGNILRRVVSLVRPTVVHIEAQKVGLGEGVEEAGSGVIVQHRGRFFILTNRHVIRNSPLAGITLKLTDGREFNPTQIWSDQKTDVAVMATRETKLIAARLGNSDPVDIGDFVLAVGSPFGLSHSVTYGIISAKGRHSLELGADGVEFQNFFQTDAAINPGNSGGPLLNLKGEVIGINTAIASNSGGNEGIGFSIPINLAMFVARELIDRGSVARAFLGVRIDSDYDLTIAEPTRRGARVKFVEPNSAAQAAEIMEGDIVVVFDDVPIENGDHLVNQVSVTPVGKEVVIQLLRQGKLIARRTKIGTRQP